MPRFLFAYHGGRRPEDGAAYMKAWRAWMKELGAAALDPGIAVGPSKTVSASGVEENGGANPVSGISIVEADNMDSALVAAKKCPHLELGGTIEVAQALDMKM